MIRVLRVKITPGWSCDGWGTVVYSMPKHDCLAVSTNAGLTEMGWLHWGCSWKCDHQAANRQPKCSQVWLNCERVFSSSQMCRLGCKQTHRSQPLWGTTPSWPAGPPSTSTATWAGTTPPQRWLPETRWSRKLTSTPFPWRWSLLTSPRSTVASTSAELRTSTTARTRWSSTRSSSSEVGPATWAAGRASLSQSGWNAVRLQLPLRLCKAEGGQHFLGTVLIHTALVFFCVSEWGLTPSHV